MAQFDVFRNVKRGNFPLLLDVQTELLTTLATRTIVPLMRKRLVGRSIITRLNPTVAIEGTEYVAVFQEIAAVPLSILGSKVVSCIRQRDEFVRALDLLFTGI
jgi:toxin CcdB